MKLLIKTVIQAFYLASFSGLSGYSIYSARERPMASILEFSHGFSRVEHHYFTVMSFASVPDVPFVTSNNSTCVTW